MARSPMIVPASVGPGRGSAARFVAETPNSQDARGQLLFTAKLGDIADTEATLQRMADVTERTSLLQNDLDRKRLELQADPDIAGREGKFQAYSKERHAQLSEGLDGKTALAFTQRVGPMADAMSTSVRHQARTDGVERAIVTLNQTNDALVLKAGEARNPNERQALIDAMDGNIKEAFDKGWLTPAQYESARKATLTKVDQAEALRLIRENPGGMMQRLAKADFLPNLDPVARQNLIDKAGNEQLRRANLAYTAEARREVAERRQLRISGTEAMKEIIDLKDKELLTEGEIMSRRGVLDETQWKAARQMLRGGATEDSRDSLMPLETGIGTRDMKNSINDAYGAGRITTSTYRSLMARNEAALKDDQPASPYKLGREQIIKGLEPGALLSGPAADLQKQALVNALREYDEFARAQGPQKMAENPAMVLDRTAEIRSRYSLIQFNQIGEAIGVPRFVDRPREQITEADLTAAGRRLLEEHARGLMSDDELNTQLKKIETWEELLKVKARGTPGPRPLPQGGGN